MTATAATLIPQYTDEFIRIYRDGLLEDIIPFWTRHSVDRECGGFLTSLDRDGTVIDTDKAVWLQGRFVWMLSALHNTVAHYGIDPKPEWLEIAQHGIDFLDAHCFDDDGRMFFLVTREGKPLRKRRYIFSETFTTIAFAAYAQATGDAALLAARCRPLQADAPLSRNARPAAAQDRSANAAHEGHRRTHDPHRHGAGPARGRR